MDFWIFFEKFVSVKSYFVIHKQHIKVIFALFSEVFTGAMVMEYHFDFFFINLKPLAYILFFLSTIHQLDSLLKIKRI